MTTPSPGATSCSVYSATFCVTEAEVLDKHELKPVDLRIALPE